MSQIQVVGLNHRKAPVEIREKVAVPAEQAAGFLAELRPAVEEALLISTCNRVEAWMAGNPDAGARHAVGLIASRGGLAPETLTPFVYDFRGEEAVSHLFRVASSLDSMVVGETQILAQVKEAYRVAKDLGATGRVMNPLFQKAFNVAKHVHTETRIAEGKVSVASVAVELAEKVFRDLSAKHVVVLGAGETGDLTARAFRDRGVTRMTIVNRGTERAESLAGRLAADSAPLDRLPEALAAADILVACAASDRPLVTLPMLHAAMSMRGGLPMVVLDIAVPRNVADGADSIPDLYAFNIDDLQGVVARNLAARREKVERGIHIVTEEARAFSASLRSR